jgi:hypothetical protein
MNYLTDAIRRFRSIAEATTSAMVAPARTAQGSTFFGLRGLAQVERERKARMGRAKKCKGYDPKCRDKEWEVQAPTGGVALLRRQPLRGIAEATTSASVNPSPISVTRDIERVPTPGGQIDPKTGRLLFRFWGEEGLENIDLEADIRADMVDRHFLNSDPEWEMPTFVGGAEWAKRRLKTIDAPGNAIVWPDPKG